jgi:dephospho-CoA kinase
MPQRIIGITGGIATGKTTVSEYLHLTYGLPILDADIYARQALTAERLEQLRDRYGKQIFDQHNLLDRTKLGAIIFADPQERQWLESIIHPYVRQCLIADAQRLVPYTVVMVIPLLFEAQMQDLVTETWVITCPEKLQLQRLIQRNQLSTEAAQQRINSQMPQFTKIELANVVIVNSPMEDCSDDIVPNLDLDRQELHSQVDRALFRQEFYAPMPE